MVRRVPNPQFYRRLAVGRDISQLSSGATVLTQAGYSADLVLETEHAVRRVKVLRYHLAIVGTSFSVDEQIEIRARLKQVRHDLPVLLLTPEQDNPEALLSAVADCSKQRKKFRFGTSRDRTTNNHGIR